MATYMMKYNPDKHRRRSIRLKGYDYSQSGGYYVTMCVQDRECLFGEVVDGEMHLDEFGKIVDEYWHAIPDHFPNVELDEYVVMPNHVHGIIIIVDERQSVGARHAVPLHGDVPQHEQFGKPTHGTLPTIIRSFKSATTKRVNEIRNSQGESLWQRNYYEHIIRNDDELIRIREYIYNNPARWPQYKEFI